MKIILCITADDQEILVASPELEEALVSWQSVTQQYFAPVEWVETTRAEAHGILDQLIDHHEATNATLYSEKDDPEQVAINKRAIEWEKVQEIMREIERADIKARQEAWATLVSAGLPVPPEIGPYGELHEGF